MILRSRREVPKCLLKPRSSHIVDEVQLIQTSNLVHRRGGVTGVVSSRGGGSDDVCPEGRGDAVEPVGVDGRHDGEASSTEREVAVLHALPQEALRARQQLPWTRALAVHVEGDVRVDLAGRQALFHEEQQPQELQTELHLTGLARLHH